jgi:hypothetical protein
MQVPYSKTVTKILLYETRPTIPTYLFISREAAPFFSPILVVAFPQRNYLDGDVGSRVEPVAIVPQPGRANNSSTPSTLHPIRYSSPIGYCSPSDPHGADPLPPSSTCIAKTGRNHLNEEFTPLLPTGIGERF